MQELVKEFGLSGGLLISLITACFISLRWTATNVVTPLVTSGVEWMQMQGKLQEENSNRIAKLAEIEAEIRRSIERMDVAHNDPDSTFSTVHTNASIKILAEAVGRVAESSGCDVKDLIAELNMTVRQQDKGR